MTQKLLLSGFDLTPVEFPAQAEMLVPPSPLAALRQVARQATTALEEPLEGDSLPQRIRPHMRVCVVLDDLCYPAPGMAEDCRKEMLAAVLQQLFALGVKQERIRVLVANGLNRQWRTAELTDILGPVALSQPVTSHDAEEIGAHARIGQSSAGPWELSRHLVEADLIIYVNVVSMPLQAGLTSLVLGTANYKTARQLAAPELFEAEAPLAFGSKLHTLHESVGFKLQEKTPILQLSAVLNNDFWDRRWNSLVSYNGEVTRTMQVWNAMPEAVRHRAARLMKSQYRPVSIVSGPPSAVAKKSLEVFHSQHVVTVQGETDILLLGLPSVGPHSFGASQNPVLSAHLGLGLLYNFVTTKPFLKKGGVIILSNSMDPSFDKSVHAPYLEFYERVLRTEKEPQAIHDRFEAYFAGRPEYVNSYQKRNAFHGTHPLYAWYQCTPARRRAGRIFVAHGDPRACIRMGLTPASDVKEALQKAKEFLGQDTPRLSVLDLPPPFFLDVR